MFFLNLTAAEFFGLLAVLGSGITALYLLDRTKRKKIVSTLRFWVDSSRIQDQRSRKRNDDQGDQGRHALGHDDHEQHDDRGEAEQRQHGCVSSNGFENRLSGRLAQHRRSMGRRLVTDRK